MADRVLSISFCVVSLAWLYKIKQLSRIGSREMMRKRVLRRGVIIQRIRKRYCGGISGEANRPLGKKANEMEEKGKKSRPFKS